MKMICSKCKAEDSIKSDERICATYRVFANSDGEIEYDGTTEKIYTSTVEGFFCEECDENFSESQVVEMIE